MLAPAWTARTTRPRRLPVHLRRLLATGAALLPLIALSVLAAAPASAHAKLLETTPKNGRTLASPPSAVSLKFNESLLGFGVTVRVTGPDGPVTDGKATVKGAVVTQKLETDLAAGSYTLQWRVASEDGHPISGTSTFVVAAPQPTPEADPTTSLPPATAATTPAPASTTATAIAADPVSNDEASTSTGLVVVLGALVAAMAAAVIAGVALVRRRRS